MMPVDFFDTEKRTPVNLPDGFQFKDHQGNIIFSMEEAVGVAREDITVNQVTKSIMQ